MDDERKDIENTNSSTVYYDSQEDKFIGGSPSIDNEKGEKKKSKEKGFYPILL